MFHWVKSTVAWSLWCVWGLELCVVVLRCCELMYAEQETKNMIGEQVTDMRPCSLQSFESEAIELGVSMLTSMPDHLEMLHLRCVGQREASQRER